jgi:hypothetical protein
MEMKKFIISFIFIQCIWCLPLFAKVDPASLLATSKSAGFIENKGQVIDQDRKPNPAVLYLLNGNGLNVQLKKTGFSYDIFTTQSKSKAVLGMSEPTQKLPGKEIEPEEVTYHFHRIDISLLGANPSPQIMAEGKSSDYTNYYNVDHAPDGILDVHQYQKVIVKNIYPNIDIEYLLNEKGFKYNFVVHAGAQLSDIKLQYKGAPFKIHRQELIFNTTQGEFIESIPASWLIKNGLNQTVQVDYNLLDKETIGFKTQAQIALFDLVVDPSPLRLWGTYYGGSALDEGSAVCSDSFGNVCIVGYTNSTNNIASAGSHQSSMLGSQPAFLVKFNGSGVRQWGTYYGGGNELGILVCSDPSGNVYLGGRTNSTNNISTTGSHQASWAGTSDVFLVKFNTSGIRQWGTYYGGSSGELANSICADGLGNVYLTGFTSSANNIATTSSHQSSLVGLFGAFIVKFNANGVRQWGTYYGGSGNTEVVGHAICTDGIGNIYVSGYTNSTNNVATLGSHQPSLGGGYDAFLVKFNTNGVRQWGTYYGGISNDHGYALCSDTAGNVYLSGATESSSNIATVGSHQEIIGGSRDAFLVKFNTNGVRQWGNYIGGNGYDYVMGSCNDGLGNVYVTGYTTSTNNIATVGGFQASPPGSSSFAFLMKFNTNGLRQWGTYYGGLGSNNGSSICTNIFSNIYLIGTTNNNTNISTNGSHQVSFAGGSGDAFLAKFQDCSISGPLGGIGVITSSPASYCANSNYSFYLSATTANASGYWWTVPAGWEVVSGQRTSTVTIRTSGSGTFSVKAYNDCGDSTTAATRFLNVLAAPAQPSTISTNNGQLINGVSTLCNGSSATFTVTNVSGLTYTWTFPSGWSGAGGNNSATRTVSLSNDTIRVVARNAAGCNSVESKLNVRVFAVPATPSIINGGNPACQGRVNLFNVDSIAYATTYTWTVPIEWSISSGNGTPNVQVSAGNSSGNIGVTAGNFCGISSQKVLSVSSILAPSQPSVIQSSLSFPICAGTNNLTLSVSSVSGVQYRWVLPNNWQIVSGANTNQITVNLGSNATGGIIQVFPASTSNPLCEGTARTLSVSVVSFGSVGSISGSVNACAGSTTAYSIPSISGSNSYLWSLPASFSGSSTQNSINANVGTISGDYTISVRGINGSCSSAVAQLPITVHSTVSQPVSITGNTTICANSQQSYNTASINHATSYIWSLPSGWTFDGVANTNNINITAGNTSGTFNLSVRAINPGCSSQVRNISVSVNPPPQISSSISGSTNTCEGATQTYTISATNASSYTWTLRPGWSGSSTTNSIGITFNAVADTLRVVANGAGGCSSVEVKRFINVQAKPVQPIISNVGNLCSSQYETYRVNKVLNVSSYTWTIPNGWDMSPSNGISTDTSILIRPTSGVGGNISVKATSSNGCVGAERILNISSISTSIPSTPLAITGDNAFCVGVSKTYSIAAISGATGYTWTVPTGWNISSGQNSTSINVMPNTNTGTIQVQSIQGGCRSSFRSLSIFNSYTQASKPQSITPSSQPACELSSITLSSNTLIGASSYVWELPSDWSFIGNSTLQSIQVQVGSSNGNVTVRGKNDGCTSDSSLSLGMTVSKLPQFLGGIAGEKYVKANTIRNYSISASNANSYAWDIPSDWLLLGGENTNSITVLTGSQNATLLVNAINNCGSKQSSVDIITGVSAAIDENIAFKNLDIYPVPASDALHLDYELNQQEKIQFQLYGLSGQLLHSGHLSDLKGVATIQVNEWAAGLYLLKFHSQDREMMSKKIQIIR